MGIKWFILEFFCSSIQSIFVKLFVYCNLENESSFLTLQRLVWQKRTQKTHAVRNTWMQQKGLWITDWTNWYWARPDPNHSQHWLERGQRSTTASQQNLSHSWQRPSLNRRWVYLPLQRTMQPNIILWQMKSFGHSNKTLPHCYSDHHTCIVVLTSCIAINCHFLCMGHDTPSCQLGRWWASVSLAFALAGPRLVALPFQWGRLLWLAVQLIELLHEKRTDPSAISIFLSDIFSK